MALPHSQNGCYYCFLLLGVTIHFLLGSLPVCAIDVYTPEELFFENGTSGVLKCTFKSNQVISSAASVSWTFQPEGSDVAPMTIFHFFGGKPFLGDWPQFKGRVIWDGDLNKKDASIKLLNMQFTDNGTYTCDVKNPPDISVVPSRIQLRILRKEAFPPLNTTVIVGSVIGILIGIALIIFVICIVRKKMEHKHDYQGCTSIESVSVSSQATRMGMKAESSTEGSRCSSPSAPVQGPVIYAQLDHSGTKSPNSFHKNDSVVYADIRKN